MFSPGNILYFPQFIFPNGNPSKPKYFIVINTSDDDVVVASLPTSRDHIPNGLPKNHGCINNERMCVNCYYFEKERIISECGTFGFPRDTYVYGEQVMLLNKELLGDMHREKDDCRKIGRLKEIEYKALTHCLSLSKSIKRKIKAFLQ